MNKLIYSILLTAVLTSSLHSMSTLKKLLMRYESYEAIPKGKYRTSSIASNFEGSSPFERILNNFAWEKTAKETRRNTLKSVTHAYTHFTIFTDDNRQRGSYDTYEKMGGHHSSDASEQTFFLRLTRERELTSVYDIPDPLILLCNKEGELIDPSFQTNRSRYGADEFVTKKEHQDAQYKKQVYEINKTDGRSSNMKTKWTYAKVYHPGCATFGKYAVIVGSLCLGYKLCKKMFGKTEKPAPAKGAAAKGKRVAARAVS